MSEEPATVGLRNKQKVESTIHQVILTGDVLRAQEMIRNDDKLIKKADESGRLPIHWAASLNQTELLEFLICRWTDMDIDCTDDANLTPLIIAAAAGKLDNVRLLLSKGADINAKNINGHSALQYAASKNYPEIVEILLSNHADVNICDELNATPLHRASSIGNTKVVRLLLDKGEKVDVNAKDNAGSTPLHLACEEDRVEEAKMLVHYGSDLTKENKAKKTPLDYASKTLAEILNNISATNSSS